MTSATRDGIHARIAEHRDNFAALGHPDGATVKELSAVRADGTVEDCTCGREDAVAAAEAAVAAADEAHQFHAIASRTHPGNLVARLDAAAAHVALLDARETLVYARESSEPAAVASDDWADLGDLGRTAAHEAAGVLAAARPIIEDAPLLRYALDGLADVFGDGMTAVHVGGSFTCSEAETIAYALLAGGHREAAVTFMVGHGDGDDDPDDEHRDVYAASRAGIGDAALALARAHVDAL